MYYIYTYIVTCTTRIKKKPKNNYCFISKTKMNLNNRCEKRNMHEKNKYINK